MPVKMTAMAFLALNLGKNQRKKGLLNDVYKNTTRLFILN